ncbi:hypothetical protein [uncultured Eudoraea sp.]|uniref:hypothetical protein n=1 Tax=uncultured Eudoraea sp. TaxID=1035614 RepID=UPI002606B355|nr:hypothetical protein [uncultured Eudoraea sp.]
MLQKNSRQLVYAALLLALSIVGTSAIANTKVYELISEIASEEDEVNSLSETNAIEVVTPFKSSNTTGSFLNATMFMTIIQGANEEVVCPNDGSTLAKFFLCGL